MTNEDIIKLDNEINKRILFHQQNTNDPHNVGNAIIGALSEVSGSIRATFPNAFSTPPKVGVKA